MTSAADLDAFTHHALWEEITKTRGRLHESAPRNEQDRHTLARALATVNYLAAYKPLDPHLFPTTRSSAATELLNSVRAIGAQVAGWDQKAGMLGPTIAEIDRACDSIMGALRNHAWPSLQKESRALAIRQAAEAYELAAEKSLEALQASSEQTRTELAALLTEARTAREEAGTARALAESAAERFEGALQTQDQASRDALANLLRELQTEAQRRQADAEAEAAKLLESLGQYAERGSKLVRMVGDQAVAEGYYNFARKEAWAYRVWNVAGFLIAGAAVLYLAVAFRDLSTLTVQAVLVRTAISLPAVAAAAYAFQQASRRHRQSVEARYRALDLLALPPFSNDMSPGQQEKLRVALGERLFAAPLANHPKADGNPQDQRIDLDALKAIAEVLKTLRQ